MQTGQAEKQSEGGALDTAGLDGAPLDGAGLLPLGSSACLASLRSAAAKPEDGAAWAGSALLVAGLPLGTRAPLSGEGVRGLTVAVVLVAVESIPSEGDLGSWLMPATGKEEPSHPGGGGAQHQSRGRMQGGGPPAGRQEQRQHCREHSWPWPNSTKWHDASPSPRPAKVHY